MMRIASTFDANAFVLAVKPSVNANGEVEKKMASSL